MISLTKRWALKLCVGVGLFIPLVDAHALVILQYHHVSDYSPASTSTSPAVFNAHLQFLKKNEFNVISIERLPELLELARQGRNLPDRTVIITFDDGYRSIYENAYPLLKKCAWPFTVFVNSMPHDQHNPLYMSWKQMREMKFAGATYGNHSDSHIHFLRRKEGESYAAWQQRRLTEIKFAEKRLRKELGVEHKYFAHPYGEYDEDLLRMLRDLGYIAFGQQSGPVAITSHPQALPRFPMGGVYGKPETFADKLFSLPFPLLKVDVKDAKGRTLRNPELPKGESTPILRLSSPIFRQLKGVECFASGQGRIKVKAGGASIEAVANRPLAVGRSRYNCTLHAGGGRYYWYSRNFIRKNTDGSWYYEA